MTLYRRLTLVAEGGPDRHRLLPGLPARSDAAEVLGWLRSR